MTLETNRRVKEIFLVLLLALLGTVLLLVATSYFNTAEINAASTRCYETGGKVLLEIHNNFTSDYSFACEK